MIEVQTPANDGLLGFYGVTPVVQPSYFKDGFTAKEAAKEISDALHSLGLVNSYSQAQDPSTIGDIPVLIKTSSHTLVAGDTGRCIRITTGGVTVPNAVLSPGDVVTVYNDSSSNQTITQGASVTLRLAGTARTGNRTLAQYGICTIMCLNSNLFVISGSGLT